MMNKKGYPKLALLCVIALFLIPTLPGEATSADPGVEVIVDAQGVVVIASSPEIKYMMLRVVGPDGALVSEGSSEGGPLDWQPGGGAGDGLYKYEVRFGTITRRERSANDTTSTSPPQRSMSRSGAVTVKDGAVVIPTESEEEVGLWHGLRPRLEELLARIMDHLARPAFADQVFDDDVIIYGSECVGYDCEDGESFGFDTIRFKENNLRIKFEDTSGSAGSFPGNDWEITINDAEEGGLSRFSILDVTAGNTIFTAEAGAPASSLYIDSDGDVGIGTSIPAVELHVVDGNTPALRLDQDGSGGYAAQVWDVEGNEKSLGIRDTTGSTLPFRIQPGAPNNTLALKADCKVGIGTWEPAYTLEVEQTGSAAELFLQQTDGASGLFSASGDNLSMGSYSNHDLLVKTNDTTRMTIDTAGNVGINVDTPSERLHVGGNAYISGNLEMGSSRELKENIRSLQISPSLAAFKALQPVRFNYKSDPDTETLGFIAEDVPDLVATEDRRSIRPMEIVTLLTSVVQEQQRIIEELKDGVVSEQQRIIEELSRKVAELEARVAADPGV